VEAGLVQRTRALAAFVSDAYGDREIVRAGLVPARVLDSADDFEPWMLGVAMPGASYVTGLDLVRGDDGELRVLEDNIRTPSGFAYLVAARAAGDAHLSVPGPVARRDPAEAYELLGNALRASAPDGAGDPHVVAVSDGPSNSAWWEHRQIARALDIPLLTPSALSVRRGRLHAQVDGAGTRPVDVVYRRTDEDRLRDDEGRATWLADLLLEPVRQGTLSVVNPLGSGVADDKLVHAYVESMVRFYLGEEPLLMSVPSHDLGDPEVRRAALARLDELVFKPRSGLGGHGIVVGPHASDEDRRAVARRVAENPGDWVAQEMVLLSTHPTICEGSLEARHVDLRPYVIGTADAATAVPGCLTRVALDRGSMVVNSSQNGGVKDTWVPA
jgi:carboxylate-amine ligase